MKKKKFSGKQFAKGFIVGSFIGGGAALLLAPRSGKETQQKINNRLDETIDLFFELKNNLNAVESNFQNVKQQSTDLLPSTIEEVQKDIKQFQFVNAPRVDIIKEQLTKINSELSNFKDKMNATETRV